MFLHAPTRPFTYFLRLKHMVKNTNKKISCKSILFIMLLKEKNQRFLNYRLKMAL